MWGIDGLLLLLAYGDLISRIVPSSEESLKRLAFLSSLPWYWKIIIILVVNILLMSKGALTALRRREDQRDSYAARLRQIEESKPHIMLRQPSAEHVENIAFTNRSTMALLGRFPFVKVRFVNRPAGNFPNSIAKSIRARVSFYKADDGKLLLEMDGRWDDSDQPSTRGFGKSRNDLLVTDFGIEEEHGLDIAYRDLNTGNFFAFNNDSYNYPDLKKPEHLLPGESFLVRIRLIGVYVNEMFAFKFSATPDGIAITRPN